jgi:hypothetical protein
MYGLLHESHHVLCPGNSKCKKCKLRFRILFLPRLVCGIGFPRQAEIQTHPWNLRLNETSFFVASKTPPWAQFHGRGRDAS